MNEWMNEQFSKWMNYRMTESKHSNTWHRVTLMETVPLLFFSRHSEVHKDRQCKTEVGICSLAKFSIIWYRFCWFKRIATKEWKFYFHVHKNFLWSHWRTLVYNHDTMSVCKLQKFLWRWVLGCTYGIGTKPLHQIEVPYQSDVIKASTSDLLMAKTMRHSNDTCILANSLSVIERPQ